MGYRRHYALLMNKKGQIIKERSNNDGDNGHAEMRTLRNIDRKDTFGGTIIIVRQVLNTNGGCKGSMSKPCKMCMQKIILSGVKNIIYSTGDNIKPWEKITL